MTRTTLLAAALTGLASTCHPRAPTTAGDPAVQEPSVDAPSEPGLPPLPPKHVGPLTGLVVVISPGHGRLIERSDAEHQRPLTWNWQRTSRHRMREDEWTAAFCADDLEPRLTALGATVLSLRELDRHAESVRVSATDPGFQAPHQAPLADGTAQIPAGSWARWTLRAPEPGTWRLYARWSADAAQTSSASYVITTSTGERRVDVDQTRHGGVWWPLGSVDLTQDPSLTVTLRGEGPMSAASVRLGGGTFQPFEPDLGSLAPAPFFEVAALHQLPQLGGPPDLLRLADGLLISDMRFRARWTSWLKEPEEDVVFLSVHTNAGGGRGTMIFYGVDDDTTPPLPARDQDRQLATRIHEAVSSRVSAVAPGWRVQAPKPGNYSEISPYWNEATGVLFEAGFHSRHDDAARLVEPEFRAALADGLVEGVTAWWASRSPR